MSAADEAEMLCRRALAVASSRIRHGVADAEDVKVARLMVAALKGRGPMRRAARIRANGVMR